MSSISGEAQRSGSRHIITSSAVSNLSHSPLELDVSSGGSIWITPSCAQHIERLTLKERRRIFGAFLDLSTGGSAQGSSPGREGWSLILGGRSGSSERSIGGRFWWWRKRPLKSGFTVLSTLKIEASLPLWPIAHPAVSPPEVASKPTLSSEGEVDGEEGIDTVHFSLKGRMLRSPEQEQIRRALFTQREEALIIKGAGGSGVTIGLALALCDLIGEQRGRALMLTQQPDRVRHILRCVAPDHLIDQIDLITPQSFIKTCALAKDEMDVDETHHWARFKVWLKKNERIAGPWARYPSLLYHLLLTQIWGAGGLSPESEVWPTSLSECPQSWIDSALRVAHQARKTPLYEPFRAVSALQRGTHWPWRSIKTLIIDDCTQLNGLTLNAIFEVAHEHLSITGGRWRLALAGTEWRAFEYGGGDWALARSLCQGLLGRWSTVIKLKRSERLSMTRCRFINHLSRLDEALPWSWRAERVPLRVDAPSPNDFECTQGPLPKTKEELESVIYTLKATAGAFILDLSQGELRRSILEVAPDLERFASELTLDLSALFTKEIHHLVVYAPPKTQDDASLKSTALDLPLPLALLKQRTSLDLLILLLSKTADRWIWLGPLPSLPQHETSTSAHPEEGLPHELWVSNLQRMGPQSVTALMSHFSDHSSWGGLHFFKTLHQARALLSAASWGDAHLAWRSIAPHCAHILGEDGDREAQRALSALHDKALELALSERSWPKASAFYLEKPQFSESHKRVLSLGFRECVERSEELRSRGDWVGLQESFKQFWGLEALPPARAHFSELRDRLWSWSVTHLECARPQSSFQQTLLLHLKATSPSAVEYQLLADAYEGATPKPIALCERALELLALPPSDVDTSHRRAWSMTHLTRWVSYLLEPERRPPRMWATPQTLATGFALVAAREGVWARGATLFALSERTPPSKLPILLASSSGELEPLSERAPKALSMIEDDRERRRVWAQAYLDLKSHQGLHEKRRECRQSGDLKTLLETTSDLSAPPLSPELQQAIALLKSLEGSRGIWYALTTEERKTLQRAWRRISAEN
jgi:hypothetical protein